MKLLLFYLAKFLDYEKKHLMISITGIVSIRV